MYQSLKVDRGFSQQSDQGHVDLHRARDAGLLLGFFTGFPTSSHYETEKMMRNWLEYFGDPTSRISQVTTLLELENHITHFQSTTPAERRIGAILHFEGAAGIDTELNRLYIYHGLGLRSLSLTWNEQNQFATGVGDGDPSRGVTQEGKDLLDAMENLDIMIDVSHLNDKSFWDVHSHTNTPIFASHSNLRSICSHKRNLTEEMAVAIAASGGSIGINFCKAFLHDDPETASMADAIVMIEQLLEVAGPDHVHIGSDFDGCTLPDDMKDIRFVLSLFNRISETWDKKIADKISSGNMLRLIRSYWS